MYKITLVIFITLIFTSCGNEQPEKYEYHTIFKQITSNGNYVIYDYARFGSMAFSSDVSGTELFKTNEPFKEKKGINLNGSISEWISDDTLLVFNFKSDLNQPKDTLPIKTEVSYLGDFVVKTIYYKVNSGGRYSYNFDSVSTTNDSILVRTINDNRESQILRFPLGATKIKSDNDSIIHIEICTQLKKSMNFILKNPDGTLTKGLPEVGTVSYDLTPTKRISPRGLNERKIFWEYVIN